MPESGIFKTEPFYKKALFWQIAVPVCLFLLTLLMFRQEFSTIWSFLRQGEEAASWQKAGPALAHLIFNVLAFIFFGLVSLLLVSQFVLPVRTLDERIEVFKRILLYLTGGHGPAIKVREAKLVASDEELKSSKPGVAFVDLCSAIALERRWLPVRGVAGGERSFSARRFLRLPRRILNFQKRHQKDARVRIAGPGIVFTEWGEKIRGVADLRRQFRLTPNINAYSRDGFEIRTHVWVLFGLGEPSEVIKVTYTGDKPEDLRSLTLVDKKESGQKRQYIQFGDEFDAVDKAEISQYVGTYRPSEEPVWQGDASPEWVKPPYVFDPERVFAAIYAQAQTQEENTQEQWSDLPGKVAIAAFRDMLSVKVLDDLVKPKVAFDQKNPSDTFPLLDFRKEFSRKVRNLGVLSFQFVRRKDGQLPVNGTEWSEDEWEILPAQPLRTSKVLRDRGVRVVAAGFPEIIPTQVGVREGWSEYWAAQYQQRAQLTDADHSFEAVRLRTKVRAQTQRELQTSLKLILDTTGVPREALALRVLQALEGAVSNPSTRRMLPGEALEFLWDLRRYLAPGAEEQ